MEKKLFLSVDLDTWCHCRWASGSEDSRWPDAKTAMVESYGCPDPGEGFADALDWTLDVFDEFSVRATFFILGEMAQLAPGLVRAIAARGHEIGLHGMHHVDNFRYDKEQFREMIQTSRALLQDVSGERVVGYRAANLIIDSEQMGVLEEEGFLYDSSVCPSRSFKGKYQNMGHAPGTPYHPDAADVSLRGCMSLVELPMSVFPVLKMPTCSGIMSRVVGCWWSRLGLALSLRSGYASYYFHPYEVATKDEIPANGFYQRLFCRRVGEYLRGGVRGMLERMSGRVDILCGRELAERFGERGDA